MANIVNIIIFSFTGDLMNEALVKVFTDVPVVCIF